LKPLNSKARPRDNPPLVSVVIPAFRCADQIANAINSVIAQSFSSYEILVINDGSPDAESLERALLPYGSQIQYLKQENRGPSGARNLGILNASGQFVAFLDSDDSWLPDHLAQQMELLLSDPSLDLVYGDSKLVRDGAIIGHAFGLEPQHPPVSFEKILTEECTVGTSSTVAKRQALVDAGLFDERFRCCEDFDLWLRMAFRGSRMDFDPGLHVVHHLSPDSLSGDRYIMKRARIEVYEKTASTLPVSRSQTELIRRLIASNEAECQTDLTKQFLRSRQYEKALQSAKSAGNAQRTLKMRVTVIGIRHFPRLFRFCHGIYEQLLTVARRIRTVAATWQKPNYVEK
jgi:glycosyltransferase involved in cell wall biosynthesis